MYVVTVRAHAGPRGLTKYFVARNSGIHRNTRFCHGEADEWTKRTHLSTTQQKRELNDKTYRKEVKSLDRLNGK